MSVVASGASGRDSATAEVADHRNEHEIREHAAGAHDRRDSRSDDVADAEQLGRDLGGNRSVPERSAEDLFGNFLPGLERDHHRLVDECESESGEDRLRARAGAELFLLALRGLGMLPLAIPPTRRP